MRIGIDVGGTHSDAVILDGDAVIGATKSLTSANVVSGIVEALDSLLGKTGVVARDIQTVMIGTTQFTNAIIERKELSPVAAIRIGLPSGEGIPPMVDWPDDLLGAFEQRSFVLPGGYLFDGHPLAVLEQADIEKVIKELAASKIRNIAISSAFSPMNDSPEQEVARHIRTAIPEVRITLSSQFGRLGLLERENAALLNTALLPFADRVVTSFIQALERRNIHCPLFISQNDGTLMNADFVRAFPALTFASGPTNSLRGAHKLTGLSDAIVVDIGGTTSDIGVLQDGFPRDSYNIIKVGGVRTNFRMPDILAVGLGGGSLVSSDGLQVGPRSLGHRLVEQGLVFGGDQLTITDILVASDEAVIGDPGRVSHLSQDLVQNAKKTMVDLLDQSIEMMKPGGKAMPVILVGGGAVLVSEDLQAASQTYRPEHAGVANAIGAAIAQIGGEAEKLISLRDHSRKEAIEIVSKRASDHAVAAGADPNSIQLVDLEEMDVPYMDDTVSRIRVKAVGDLDQNKFSGRHING